MYKQRRIIIIMNEKKHRYFLVTIIGIILLGAIVFLIKPLTVQNRSAFNEQNNVTNNNDIDTIDSTANDLSSTASINEAKAIELGNSYIKQLFDVDLNQLQRDISFNTEGSIQPKDVYFITYVSKVNKDESDWNYAVRIDTKTGEITAKRSSMSNSTEIITKNQQQAILDDSSWIDFAKNIIEKKLNEENKIKQAEFLSAEDEQRFIDVTVKMENNSIYIVSVYYPDKILRGVTYIPENNLAS